MSESKYTYTAEEIEKMKTEIDAMDQRTLAKTWRFAESGHPYFRADLPLYDHFQSRFKAVGGMTPEVSKDIGW